ncbi:hypothetical protein LEM8419_01023 [Neolewinella maritima]|uniref:Lipocalin-like domain-containing protein n=1 Tax=Neolewinella maritima TaxID=1383882 RepID=A0ABM9AZ18_9BACT|nr:hypothetical protein [Neolewinella maritima]CAH0999723.1 hypothetical protein LEM8419_01023 [Neolewinella maritima]
MRFVFLLSLPYLFFACGSDAAELPEEATTQLEGRWELVEARRDNVKTGVLDGLYLDFGSDGAFTTNLLSEDNEPQRGSYVREGNELSTSGVMVPLDYEVIALEGDILSLQSRYEGFIFSFLLQRAPRGGEMSDGDADPASED